MPLKVRNGKCSECDTPIYSDNKSGLCAGCARKVGIKGPLTAAEREQSFRLCGAPKRTGGNCRQLAGAGTDHPGFGRCNKHRGNSEVYSKQAMMEMAQVEMAKQGAIEISPQQALMGLLKMTAASVAWIQYQISMLTPDQLGTGASKALVQLFDQERDRLLRISTATVQSGVAQQLVEVEMQKVELLGEALKGAAQDAGLDNEQRAKLGSALRTRLAELETTAGNGSGGIFGS